MIDAPDARVGTKLSDSRPTPAVPPATIRRASAGRCSPAAAGNPAVAEPRPEATRQ